MTKIIMIMKRVRLGSIMIAEISATNNQLPNFSPSASFHPYFAERYMPRNGIWESMRGVFSSILTVISVENSFSKLLIEKALSAIRGLSPLSALYIPLPRRNKSIKKSTNSIPCTHVVS